MKLKILLMPVAVIISLVLIIWHIYPAWFGEELSSISSVKAEIAKTEREIGDIKARKDNIQKLSQSIDANVDTESLVNKFYPTYRNDEDVVNSINVIAFNEGIFLLDMKVDYRNVQSTDDTVRILSIPVEKVEVSAQSTEAAPQLTDFGVPPPTEEELFKTKIKFIEASLQIYGNYDQIKRFMAALNKAGLINNIQTFNVYKKEQDASTNAGEETAIPSDTLNVDIVVDFAYFVSSEEAAEKLLHKDLFNKSEFDFSKISSKKDILTGNYKKSEVGETGLLNPFAKETAAVE